MDMQVMPRKRYVMKKPDVVARSDRRAVAETIFAHRLPTKEAADSVKAPAASVDQTEHQKVFGLVRAGDIKAAARLAARLINAGDVTGFFIYGNCAEYRRADAWLREEIASARRQVRANVYEITPPVAQVLLSKNDGNRRVKPKNLENLMRDLIAGSWDVNGETVKVSVEGLINDAQHRLFSILLTGVAAASLVAFGLKRETKRTVDVGDKRTAADRASMRGEANAVVATSAAGLAFEIYNGRAGTPVEVDDYLSDNAGEIHDAINAVGQSNTPRIGKAAPVVAAMHLMSLGAHTDDIRAFFHVVRTGLTDKNTNPARAIYNEVNPTGTFAQSLKMPNTRWVSTLCAHFKLWADGKRQRTVLKDAALPVTL